MKALTLKHPWAFAICHWGKRVENRTWHPPKSLIGQRFAIHGGKVPTTYRELNDIRHVGTLVADRFGLPPGFRDVTLEEVLLPGIVAVATLDSVITSPAEDPWFDGTGYGWRLRDVIVLATPIEIKGAQGLWDIPEPFATQLANVGPSICHPEREDTCGGTCEPCLGG
jgi:hypothetical protein